MSDAALAALFSAGIPSIVTAITAVLQKRANNMHAARQSILQLILEDHVAVQEGHLPTNYQAVFHEYDIYKKNGGNSYITQKVEEYKTWFLEQEKYENSNKK